MTTAHNPLRLAFTVPYPPGPLLPNTRAPWGAKQKVGRAYAEEAGLAILAAISAPGAGLPGVFKHGRLRSTHHFTRHAADADNCVGALKSVIDVLQVATAASGKRYRLGILEDDRNLEVLPPARCSYCAGPKTIDCVLEVW